MMTSALGVECYLNLPYKVFSGPQRGEVDTVPRFCVILNRPCGAGGQQYFMFMKKVMLFFFAMSSMMTFAQRLDGYNCVFLNSHTNNQWGLDDRLIESFINKGFKVVTSRDDIPSTLNERLAT